MDVQQLLQAIEELGEAKQLALEAIEHLIGAFHVTPTLQGEEPLRCIAHMPLHRSALQRQLDAAAATMRLCCEE